ncbi:MAG TPA: PilZ domain-containing protein [Terriglobales bacterium]|nr:PilZ domain-containing protein [Terriglobales bacterium]
MALTALVVCADAKVVPLLLRILSDLGIQAEHCEHPLTALARLATHPFDAVLVDCKDEPAAIELIVNARQTPANRATLVIAMVDGRNRVREVFARGANFILYKPISAERASTSLRAARALMRRERRTNQRISLHAEAALAYAATENAPATVVELSESGMGIQSEGKLPPSGKVYFQFCLPGQAAPVRLSGEVVWQDSSGRVGIRFAHVPQASRRALSQWLQANLTRPGAGNPPPAPSNPLAGLGLLSVSSADRRERSRHACRLGAEVYRLGSNVPTRCSLSDISTGGCYVETSDPFPSGTAVQIVVRARDMKLRIQGNVQAVHRAFGMGVAFSLKTAEEREQVQQLIALVAQRPELDSLVES